MAPLPGDPFPEQRSFGGGSVYIAVARLDQTADRVSSIRATRIPRDTEAMQDRFDSEVPVVVLGKFKHNASTRGAPLVGGPI